MYVVLIVYFCIIRGVALISLLSRAYLVFLPYTSIATELLNLLLSAFSDLTGLNKTRNARVH
jgi:hypothetical protein